MTDKKNGGQNRKKADPAKETASQNIQSDSNTYDVPPEYIGAYNPAPRNEIEHCQEAIQRHRNAYQFHRNQAIKWREIFVDAFEKIGQAEIVIRKHNQQMAEALKIGRLARTRLEKLQGVANG